MRRQTKIDKENLALRKRSGDVFSSDALTSFLYNLMRDHLPAGVVEGLVRKASARKIRYCNGHLASYAQDIANRIHAENAKRNPPRPAPSRADL